MKTLTAKNGVTYTTGKLARRAGVNLQTIRYYERSGLLPAPERNESGYRQYTENALVRIRFIKKAQALGFSLKEIQELLRLRADENRQCKEVQDLVLSKIEELNERIVELKNAQSTLQDLIKDTTEATPAPECPFLVELEKQAAMAG
ncbi:MAG: heavy metal-responsive transcriptional regulator [Leptospiraceae bacterium]|nr:heavy metal-responsive transcriptional regulator [Leptospiraceae bacterium]|tara:strand:+ start:108 stop:548 length:441 start_codon:yes stop_codon:yes gene_type:complete